MPLLLAVLAALASPGETALAEARHALAMGRFEQARLLVATAIKEGAAGSPVERLLADLSFANQEFGPALARYEALLAADPSAAELATRAGVSALRLGEVERATALLDRAMKLPGADWSTFNARGAAADLQADWETASTAYAEALRLAPERPEVLNNAGWSLLLQGRWEEAEALLAKAAALAPRHRRIADNHELARTALASDLPLRRPDESSAAWAARLNDAGVAAALRGDKSRAIAAFSRALEASDVWYVRAANNLAGVEGGAK